jgi:hypothetical protein
MTSLIFAAFCNRIGEAAGQQVHHVLRTRLRCVCAAEYAEFKNRYVMVPDT